ncbi:hypothetical protein BHE74_00008278, partial [Ensete ventricosum]
GIEMLSLGSFKTGAILLVIAHPVLLEYDESKFSTEPSSSSTQDGEPIADKKVD